MLKKKMFRDILENKSQFITIFLMSLIGIMVYVGIEAYMEGMIQTANTFYTENNLQDLNVIGTNFSKKDLEDVKNISHVNNAERKLVLTATDADNPDKTYLLSFVEENNISKFYIIKGIPFDKEKSGVWLDNFYAEKNNLSLGDTIKIKYDDFILEEKILGFINVPDHIYDTKDASELIPNRESYGFVYLSSNEIPSSYIKKLIMKSKNIPNEETFNYIFKDFNYQEYIPFNYLMIDVDNKDNVAPVKKEIEESITSSLAVIKIEDTASYQMYQGEIDEGKAYIGIFSGLFIFIAMLSVITTMTRVIKKQKIQIGTLKALGFKNHQIISHYIGYGFWISLLAALCGILLGRFFIGTIFINLEMSFFEVPNGHPIVKASSYLVALLVILLVSLITYLTCRKELRKNPAESLRNELPKVKKGSLNLTTKGLFKHLNFSTKWNLRDITRNKFRTITGILGIVGCCTLIVCAIGMLNSMNHFISLQFDDLYNFKYKLTIKENITENELNTITDKYGTATSETLGIDLLDKNDNLTTNNILVTDANNYLRFQDPNNNFITINNNEGVYITSKLAQTLRYKVGDTIKWRIYGEKTYHETPIVGLNKDPQNQNITMTRAYLESLNIKYQPDSLYTNTNIDKSSTIPNIELIQDINSLKYSMESMLSTMKQMITLIIFFAILLGAIIIYNMGILSYSEKTYQFATLKVLGFKDKSIKKIFIEQNIWITIASIIIGLPSGYYLTTWLFHKCLDENFDIAVHIDNSTYIIATIGTLLVSLIVSYFLSKKINKIDMVSSLKGNE